VEESHQVQPGDNPILTFQTGAWSDLHYILVDNVQILPGA